jgi:2-polyprenyl-3-methyl-5-hydroxy-6-metoxy-1,4-benzoquinol methylase
MNTPIAEKNGNTKMLPKWDRNVTNEIKLDPTIERLVPDAFLQSPYASQREIAKQHFRRYKKASEYVQGGRILDIACGVGYGSRMLRDAGATEVIAVDLSSTAIEYAQQRYGAPGIEFICANAEEFKLPGTFDVIVTMETVEHLQNPLAFLQKLRKGLSKGGKLILSVPLGQTSHFDPYHIHDFDEANLTNLLEAAGFSTDVQYRDYETCFMPRLELLAMSRDRIL